LVVIVCRNVNASGPLTSRRFNGVMSNIATRLRATSASAPAIGDQNREAHSLRAGISATSGSEALASYQ
jgi:hypothetical protein